MVIEKMGLSIAPTVMNVGRLTGAVGAFLAVGEGVEIDRDVVMSIVGEFPGMAWMTPVSHHAELAEALHGQLLVVGKAEPAQLEGIAWATWPIVQVPADWIGVPPSGIERSLSGGGKPSPSEIHLRATASRCAGITPRFLDDLWSVMAWTEVPTGTVVVEAAVNAAMRERIVGAAMEARTPWLVQFET